MVFHPSSVRAGWAAFLVVAAFVSHGGSASAQREAQTLSASFRKAAEAVLPAVVAVRPLNSPGIAMPFPAPGRPMLPGPIVPGLPRPAPELWQQAGGSGLIVDERRGLILTCEQAAAGATRVAVILSDGRVLESTRIIRDSRSELVLLAIDPRDVHLTPAEWAEAAPVELGDWVLAVGRVDGPRPAVSAGIISGRGPGQRPGDEDDVIWTDAVVSPVNAGGPLVNLDGKVLGISRAGRWGEAIPSDRARRIASDLAERGHVRRGYLGLIIGPLDLHGGTQQLLITGVTPGSPAAEAGLQPGDRIVTVNGQPVNDLSVLSRMVEEAPVGQEFKLAVERDSKRRDVSVKTRERPDPGANPAGPILPQPGRAERRLRPRDRLQAVPPLPPRRSAPLRSDPADEKKTPTPPEPAPRAAEAPDHHSSTDGRTP
jgi:serine protease Do